MDIILQCGKSKLKNKARVDLMYTTGLWNIYRKYKPIKPHRVFVLSALYGLKEGSEVIKPYNLQLTEKRKVKPYEIHFSKLLNRINIQASNYSITKAYFVGSNLYYKTLKIAGVTTYHIRQNNNKHGYMYAALKSFLESNNA